MDRPDYERIRERLSQAGDAELLKIVRVCDAVNASASNRSSRGK